MMAPPLEGYRSLADVAFEVGVSYRRADYWVTQGHVRAWAAEGDHTGRTVGPHRLLSETPNPSPGSGYFRVLNDHEARVLDTMYRMVLVGLSVPLAARVARSMVEGAPVGHLGHGLGIVDGQDG